MCEYESVVQMLLSRGAEADTPTGHFGTALSLTAYMGLCNTFNSLLQQGASLNASGGFLQSPLAAAILGGHSKITKHILSLGPGGRPEALCFACKKGNLPVVKALLDSGVQSAATPADGQTALQLALAKFNYLSVSYRTHEDVMTGDEEEILNLLLDSNTTKKISDQDLIAATQIQDDSIRERVLDIMISRAISPYFPEEGLIQLLHHDRYHDRYNEHSTIEKLLQDHRIQEIPIRVLLAAGNIDSIKMLVAYDPKYNTAPAAFDATMTEGRYGPELCIEKVVELLLYENEAIDVSESDILAALRLRSGFSFQVDRSHILKIMFENNPELRITEEMLKAVQTTHDLDLLLAHTSPEKGLVTPAVMSAVAESCAEEATEMLRMLHDFQNTAITIADL
ncbi:uncharacterized protein BHQ10_002691 [Talaromyces amestolkiae]|uniref:Uncharacterized protein n=1 Tax=Talaromyces amestolkiae TaxID=1196081 RepID=A0A364KT18_TALAM|nr:uncharacterized protein BHQ10_002691 [Talaromyces amestolkiae]RAO66679.1 hypothetical protein BHQ10_002691 [Talaromyces amestolkiae]